VINDLTSTKCRRLLSDWHANSVPFLTFMLVALDTIHSVAKSIIMISDTDA